MSKTKIPIMVAAVLFLSVFSGYCQGLSDQERQIYYDTAWEMLQIEYQMGWEPTEEEGRQAEERTKQFLAQTGVSEAQLGDIIKRGNEMPFTAVEEQLVADLDSQITDDSTGDEIMSILQALADKYQMSMGQVSTVYTRSLNRD